MITTILVQQLDIQTIAETSTIFASVCSILFGLIRLVKQQFILKELRDIKRDFQMFVNKIEDRKNKLDMKRYIRIFINKIEDRKNK